jgi:hypothetical protein
MEVFSQKFIKQKNRVNPTVGYNFGPGCERMGPKLMKNLKLKIKNEGIEETAEDGESPIKSRRSDGCATSDLSVDAVVPAVELAPSEEPKKGEKREKAHKMAGFQFPVSTPTAFASAATLWPGAGIVGSYVEGQDVRAGSFCDEVEGVAGGSRVRSPHQVNFQFQIAEPNKTEDEDDDEHEHDSKMGKWGSASSRRQLRDDRKIPQNGACDNA